MTTAFAPTEAHRHWTLAMYNALLMAMLREHAMAHRDQWVSCLHPLCREVKRILAMEEERPT